MRVPLRRSIVVAALGGAAATAALPAAASATSLKPEQLPVVTRADVQRDLDRLVAAAGGPPGAIVTFSRRGSFSSVSAGRANVARRGAPRAADRMRIASVAKAFNGAVALHLVEEGRLGLDDTIGQRLPSLPSAWAGVTIRQLLNHTSGLPDYTRSDGFARQAQTRPRAYVSPQQVIGWVRRDPLAFSPGSRYEYSNTDNIVVGLIAEAVTGERYGALLQRIVFAPARLTSTSFPTAPPLPRPFIHGYVTEPGAPPQDVSTFLSPSGAWASGAIVSTPANLNAFIRSYLGLRFFGDAQQAEQMRFVRGGQSSPPGPGRNAAGLALFRYTSRCGTVYGHTGNFPGYVQFAAATADGRHALTTSLNIPAPSGRLLTQLRKLQATAICALFN